MLSNKKYATIVAIAALTASRQEVRAIRAKADSEWHLAMVPDGFSNYGNNNFISAPGRNLGFGFGDPFASNFGAGFGGFDDFSMPHIPSFGGAMQDMMRRAEEDGASGNGPSYSSSSSSSFSSSVDADGKRHEKKSKSGEQKVCKDGQCKVVKCENGHCHG